MTRRKPCIVTAALLSLITVATSASAECAWVMWIEEAWSVTYERDARPTEWTLVQAVQSEEICANAAAAKIKLLAQDDGVERRGNIISKSFPSGYQQSSITRRTRVLRVPDTVDPREPKGTTG